MATPNDDLPKPARLVMLVDNGVNGDSRVQKTARSAAEHGWEVILLGRSPNGRPQSWQLGDAEVRLLRMASPLKARRHEFRRRWVIAPLAYPPTGIAEQRSQAMRAWKIDLKVRRALLAQTGASGVRQRLLQAQALAAKVMAKWVSLRAKQATFGQQYRTSLRAPSDRAYTWFWHRVSGERSWRRLEPNLWDYELAFGKTVDSLKPDVIYANDFRMLGVGARAKIRGQAKRRDIKLIWDVHEYLPGVKPRVDNHRWMVANVAHEHEYAPYADAVITVSERLAEMLKSDHSLRALPTVVLNAPSAADVTATGDPGTPDIRTACGLDKDTPLFVYSGAAAAHRGLGVMLEAMPQLEHVHVAFVVNAPTGPYLTSLVKRAQELNVADRLHVLPYVAHSDVVRFLSTATAGVIPIHHWLNHEIQLITKFFEYSHAGLPILVSDVETMAETVRLNGQGEVFRVDDVEDYVRAAKMIISDLSQYRAAYESMDLEPWTWEAQAANQDQVYRSLVPSDRHPDSASAITDRPTSGPSAAGVPVAEPDSVKEARA